MNFDKINKTIRWLGPVVAIALLLCTGLVMSGNRSGLVVAAQTIFVLLLFAVVAVALFYFRYSWLWQVTYRQWAENHGLAFFAKGGDRFNARLGSNPQKGYFQMREMQSRNFNEIFIEGSVNGRRVWLYPLTGDPPANSYVQVIQQMQMKVGNDSVLGQSSRYIKSWCLEIETHKVPLRADIHRTYVISQDAVNTESTEFEKLYHVDADNDQMILQLLDPVMIELITNSSVAAFEFSDSSVALYYSMPSPKKEVLDNMLDTGMKIAEQVDRNFPLGKYEKN